MRPTSLLTFLLFIPCWLFGQANPTRPQKPETAVRVPFVGCKSEGQVGLLKAPQGQSKTVAISADVAQKLAYYKSRRGVGVLAPRGWHCFSTYGSNGSTLYLSPEPIAAADLLAREWKGFTGPAIQISKISGDTSGRFSVAKTIARVFPAHMEFVQDVIAEGIEPASAFPSGAYATDKLTYLSKDLVEFQTPADREGLGTDSRLQKNSTPISGVAILYGEEPNLLKLSVRLPPESTDLAQPIIQQAEREAAELSRDSQ